MFGEALQGIRVMRFAGIDGWHQKTGRWKIFQSRCVVFDYSVIQYMSWIIQGRSGRMMKHNRLLLTVMSLLLAICFCGCQRQSVNDKEMVIRISMYNDISYSNWRTYVEKHCPSDVTIVWENNRNSTYNLLYQAKHGDMADMITIRRFETDSAVALAPYLMELQDEPLSATFDEGTFNTFSIDGKVYWYPAPGMMEAFIANKTLFDRYGIKVPETIAELEQSCRQWKSLGIDGLSMNFASGGYRPTAFIEGFGYSPYFSRSAGSRWLKDFLDGKTEHLPDEGGAAIEPVLRRLIGCGAIDDDDLQRKSTDDFEKEKAAITVMGSDTLYQGKAGTVFTALPYWGEDVGDAVLYTYPVFSTAVSKDVRKNPEKKAVVEKILSIMYSQEAQMTLAQGTEALLSYNKGIDLPISDTYASLAGLIKEKRYFIRFLNRNMFSASTKALQTLFSGEPFTETYNEYLSAPMDNTVIGTSDVDAPITQTSEGMLVSPAASVIAQTIRDATSADVVFIDKKSAAAPIYQGAYTANDLGAILWDVNLYQARLSVSALSRLFDTAILASTTYRYKNVEPLVDYPAIAGMKAVLSKDGIKNTLFLMDGSPLASDATYMVVISQTILDALAYLQDEDVSAFKKMELPASALLKKRLASGMLPKPLRYYEVGE